MYVLPEVLKTLHIVTATGEMCLKCLFSFYAIFMTIQRIALVFAGAKAVICNERTSPISEVKQFN